MKLKDTKRKGAMFRRRHIGPPIAFDQLPDWVPPAEAARYLRSSASTIYSLCHRGVLPCRRFGRLLRVPREALRPEVTGTTLPAA